MMRACSYAQRRTAAQRRTVSVEAVTREVGRPAHGAVRAIHSQRVHALRTAQRRVRCRGARVARAMQRARHGIRAACRDDAEAQARGGDAPVIRARHETV